MKLKKQSKRKRPSLFSLGTAESFEENEPLIALISFKITHRLVFVRLCTLPKDILFIFATFQLRENAAPSSRECAAVALLYTAGSRKMAPISKFKNQFLLIRKL
jgi:hypothetical protein